MKLKILAFGIARDIIEGSVIEIECAANAKVQDLKDSLTNNFPDFEKLRHFDLAVNQEYVKDDFPLTEGCEIAIIPPVSGG